MATKTQRNTAAAIQPQETGQQEAKQEQRLPSIQAKINWVNPKEDESVRANVSLTIGDAFAIHGIRVVNSPKGDFVSMPSYKGQKGYKDIFHAITADARQEMNDAVLKAYEQKLADQKQEQNTSNSNQQPPEIPDAPEETGMQGISQ